MNRMANNRNWGCGSIALVALVVCGLVMLLPRMFGSGDNVDNTDPQAESQSSDNNQSDQAIDLGDLVLAEEVDRDGCPVNEESSLDNVERFYVVAPDSSFPEGTSVFVRLYKDGVAVEDLPVITANQDYSDTCVNFVFETVDGNDFDEGQYEAEFWVNGNSYSTIQFDID